VQVAGAPARGVDQRVEPTTPLIVVEALHRVGRGALKLAPALDHYGVQVQGRSCLDVGASTGGFTQVLLERHAAGVIAVDVGYGQLDWGLRSDARVLVLDRTNIRLLERLPRPAELATVDVSFISLRLVLEPLAHLLDPPREMVVLVKPQFEVGRGAVGKGGVVREPAAARAAVEGIASWCVAHGFTTSPPFPSPVRGQKGNQEYFLHLRRPAGNSVPQ
jgi:23S rRNA (cytidine1920-2'-O)/16S rRNA (cytidine1409-2'-O)-methyltransferase